MRAFPARLLGRSIPIFVLVWLMVPWAAAQQQPAPEVLEYKGTIAPAHQAGVAPRIAGLLLKINFTAGKLVNQGDVLFEFGATEKELTLTVAKANRQQAEAQLRLAEAFVGGSATRSL